MGKEKRILSWPEYTDEMDRFIDSMVRSGMSYEKLAPLFNERFGTSKSKDALAQHGYRICAKSGRYTTEEQRQWIRDHFYVEGHDMARMFNKRFGTNKSYRFIRNQRQKLKAFRDGIERG